MSLCPILLVEDNLDAAELTVLALQKNNIKNDLVIVKDGIEALEYLFSTGKYAHHDAPVQPGLVLLDLKLPKSDGLSVLKQIRAHSQTRLLPVVVLTISNEEYDLMQCYAAGANSIIRKPLDFNEFLVCIGKIVEYWLTLNCPPAKFVED